MKWVSQIALGAALALVGATAVTSPLLAAKKEEKAKGPSYDLSKPVQQGAAAAQAAIAKGDLATATTELAKAQAALKTDDDRYITGSILYDLGVKSQDKAKQNQGIDMMLASGKAPPELKSQILLMQGQNAYVAKDYVKAESMLSQLVAQPGAKPETYALLAETKSNLNKPTESLQLIQQAAAAERAAGRKIPSDYYARAISIGYKAKLGQSVDQLAQQWLVDYPTASNYRDALTIYRDLNKLDADVDLDILRMLRAAGALKGERDYMEIVQATYLKYPGEAKAVLEEGQKAGFVNLNAGSGKELYDLAKSKIAGDKASLTKNVPTGRAALNTGDAYMAYGQYAEAIEMYRQALSKGGVDAAVVNTRLGQALAMSGDKAGAKQAFATVTSGPRASLARYWTIWLDQGTQQG